MPATNRKPAARTARAPKPAAPAAPAAPATVVAPQGATATAVTGTPANQVPHLVHLGTLPLPVALVAPTAPWPGWGKAVRITVAGTPGTAYANRGNIDVRTTQAHAAALAAQVPGATVRGTAGNYVRLPYTATGTPAA